MQWDIFCQVVDNFGDVGVCWRLCADLAARGDQVRLWIDDPRALQWMAPGGAPGVQVLRWSQPLAQTHLALAARAPADVWVEAFGCTIAPEFIASFIGPAWISGQKHAQKSAASAPVWINLEYLSAEAYVARCHGLPSPVQSGPGKGMVKHFFYPGFTSNTGGLLREPQLSAEQAQFQRATWLANQGIHWQGERLVSLFCYEPAALGALLHRLALGPEPTLLLVTPGRATLAFQQALRLIADQGLADKVATPTSAPESAASLSAEPATSLAPPSHAHAESTVPASAFTAQPSQFGGAAFVAPPELSSPTAQSTRMGSNASEQGCLGALRWHMLPWLDQNQFDRLLWACDLNLVRGEDSLVRALWAGKPLVWQIYPQHDDAHVVKLQAFLDWLQAPPSLRDWHAAWNSQAQPTQPLPAPALAEWQACVTKARAKLLDQTDLVSQLREFVEKRR